MKGIKTMSTMNNNLTTSNAPEYVILRCTVLNGESWDFLLDIHSLSEDEVDYLLYLLLNSSEDAPCLVPKIADIIQTVTAYGVLNRSQNVSFLCVALPNIRKKK